MKMQKVNNIDIDIDIYIYIFYVEFVHLDCFELQMYCLFTRYFLTA